MKDSEVLKPRQRCIQSQVGPISSSSRPLSPQQRACWWRTKADPSGNSYKKHPKNTQQALARSLHLPSLKLTAKESPGGRKFGLCPICKCAVWGAVEGRKSHKQALWIQRTNTNCQQLWTLIKDRSLAWLHRQVSGEKFTAGDLKQNCHCQSSTFHELS